MNNRKLVYLIGIFLLLLAAAACRSKTAGTDIVLKLKLPKEFNSRLISQFTIILDKHPSDLSTLSFGESTAQLTTGQGISYRAAIEDVDGDGEDEFYIISNTNPFLSREYEFRIRFNGVCNQTECGSPFIVQSQLFYPAGMLAGGQALLDSAQEPIRFTNGQTKTVVLDYTCAPGIDCSTNYLDGGLEADGGLQRAAVFFETTPGLSAAIGVAYAYSPVAYDGYDETPIRHFELVDPLPGMAIDRTTGRFSWTPARGQCNPLITIRAFGPRGHGDQAFVVKVSGFGSSPAQGTAVCTAPQDQIPFMMTESISLGGLLDSEGRFPMAWVDKREGVTRLYGQMMTPLGCEDWGQDGRAGAPLVDQQFQSGFGVADGLGGMFLVGLEFPEDRRAFRLGRLGADGGVFAGWPAAGQQLCWQPREITESIVSLEGNSLFYCGFVECNPICNSDVRYDSINLKGYSMADGALAWGADGGVELTRFDPNLDGGMRCMINSMKYAASRGTEGLFLGWTTNCPQFQGSHVYGQKVKPDGTLMWNSGQPMPVNPGQDFYLLNAIVPDELGGAIYIWHNFYYNGVYASRRNFTGGTGSTGYIAKNIAYISSTHDHLKAVSDGAGGAVILFVETLARTAFEPPFRIRIQKLDDFGEARWPPPPVTGGLSGGTVLLERTESNPGEYLISDGRGGAIVAYLDRSTGDSDIYATRIAADGTFPWGSQSAEGGMIPKWRPVAVGPGQQSYPQLIPDGQGGAVVFYRDEREPGNANIMSQHIRSDGTLGP